MTTPRVVVVTRRTEYEELVARHGTRGQVEFFLRTRGLGIDAVDERHRHTRGAEQAVLRAIPAEWRRAEVEREELSRFLFGPGDLVAVVGQDGLVANVAKYLDGQPVLGFDPLPGTNAGVLVPHPPAAAADLLADAVAGRADLLDRTMVSARTDDGQELVALNEVYVGQPGHQSARYELTWRGRTEEQSSSGVIVGSGTGSTGWCASIARASAPGIHLPSAAAEELVWFVREPWPSATTGTSLAAGPLEGDDLELRVRSESLVAFGDGIEDDRLLVGWGQRLRVGRAGRRLHTVR